MFDRLPFGLEKYIFTHVPDYAFIFLFTVTVISVAIFWKYKYHVLLTSYSTFILFQTLIFRPSNDIAIYSFVPFRKLFDPAFHHVDTVWEVGLNIFLFVPMGILLTLVLGHERWRLSIVLAILMSLSIELLQLITRRGVCEVDDLMANTLGCGIGILIMLLISRLVYKKVQ